MGEGTWATRVSGELAFHAGCLLGTGAFLEAWGQTKQWENKEKMGKKPQLDYKEQNVA